MNLPILRRQSYNGESIDHFLRKALLPTSHREVPALSVPTLQRLAGLIDESWLSPDVQERLDELQSSEPGSSATDHLLAPAVRSIADFRDQGGVVVRIAGASSELWQQYPAPLLDESDGRVHIIVDETVRAGIDPRSPTLWTLQDYSLIHGRKPAGQGHVDEIARIATASIKLSGFSSRPRVPERYISAALRRFTLTGR